MKRVQIAERNRLRNKACKSAVKTLMKKYFAAVDACAADPTPEAMETAQQQLSMAVSKVDKAVKRGIYHQNTGARKKARMAKSLKSLQSPAVAS
jgi:small subunit ribosomal protein S20